MDGDGPNGFPRVLLKAPWQERLKYFRDFTMKHPLIEEAYEKAKSAILHSVPGSVIFLFGLTGTGKTTLLKRLCLTLTESISEELKEDKGKLPVVMVKLNAPLPGRYDWRDYFESLLIAMEEPLINKKINMNSWPAINSSSTDVTVISALGNNHYLSGRSLRTSARSALGHRKPLVVIIDDAQHFGLIGSGRKLLDQINIIKSMASTSGTSGITHLLCGTYELLPFRNLNGQLSRRSDDIHFKRYIATDEIHQQQFKNVVSSFQLQLPLKEIPDLRPKWDYFYERSIGCVGILKDWLTRSLAMALEENSSTLLPRHLECQSLSVAKCAAILREAAMGEKDLGEEEADASRARLRLEMGLKDSVLEAPRDAQIVSNLEPLSPNSPTRRTSRPGRRNPKRDKLGSKVA